MLDIRVEVRGDKVVIDGLNRMAEGIPGAIRRGLERVAKGIHRDAYIWLSGPGAKASGTPGGGYPIPVRTGNLRRLLDWLRPGESKTGPAGTFTAGQNEVVVYDSAEYAHVIHEGRGSSAKFGPRKYLDDALARFNQGARVGQIIGEEINREVNKG